MWRGRGLTAFFKVQPSHPYMTTGKIIALSKWIFVDKVMFLLHNMLSRLVIAVIPRNKHLLNSWLQSPSAMILEPPKIKSVTVSIVSPSIWHEVMRPDAMILVFWKLSFQTTFSLSFHQGALHFFFAFCHKGGVICIAEVIETRKKHHKNRKSQASITDEHKYKNPQWNSSK